MSSESQFHSGASQGPVICVARVPKTPKTMIMDGTLKTTEKVLRNIKTGSERRVVKCMEVWNAGVIDEGNIGPGDVGNGK